MLKKNKLLILFLGLAFLFSGCASQNTSTGAVNGKIPVDARVTNKYTQAEDGLLKYYVTLYYFASPTVDKTDKNGENQTLSEVLEDIGEGIKNAGKEIGRSDDLTSTNIGVSKSKYEKLEVGETVPIYYSESNKKEVSFR